MPDYLIFTRNNAPCHIASVHGTCLRDAMANYLVGADDAERVGSGDETLVVIDKDPPQHPLEVIELIYKGADRENELALDKERRFTVSETSFEIVELAVDRIGRDYNALLTSMDPWEVSRQIAVCRKKFRRVFGSVRAIGFVWRLKDGILVTFRRNRKKDPEVLCRYLIDKNTNEISEWQGRYDDLIAQMDVAVSW